MLEHSTKKRKTTKNLELVLVGLFSTAILKFFIHMVQLSKWVNVQMMPLRMEEGSDECQFSSVQFSPSVVSDSLLLHGLQHASIPCSSSILRACSDSCPLSWWCHPTISSSVIPFSSCLQSFPASGSFPSVSSSHQGAKVLEFKLQHQSFQWIPRTGLL